MEELRTNEQLCSSWFITPNLQEALETVVTMSFGVVGVGLSRCAVE